MNARLKLQNGKLYFFCPVCGEKLFEKMTGSLIHPTEKIKACQWDGREFTPPTINIEVLPL